MGQTNFNKHFFEKIALVVYVNFERLTSIREALSLNQREMANLLHVSKSNYARWETREKIIPLKHLVNLCNLTKLTLDYVLSLSDDKKKSTKIIEYDNISLGRKIKKIRLSHHLTQLEFAKSINTTQSVISDYENGSNVIQTSFLLDICQKYNISADYLLEKEILEVV